MRSLDDMRRVLVEEYAPSVATGLRGGRRSLCETDMTGHQLGDDYLAMFSAVPGLAVALMAPDGTTLFCNETAATMFGGGRRRSTSGGSSRTCTCEWAEESYPALSGGWRRPTSGSLPGTSGGQRGRVQYQRIPITRRGAPASGDDPGGGDRGQVHPPGVRDRKGWCTSNFGPLSVLTPREAEVLASIRSGQEARGDRRHARVLAADGAPPRFDRQEAQQARHWVSLCGRPGALPVPATRHLKQVGPMPKPAAPKPVAPEAGEPDRRRPAASASCPRVNSSCWSRTSCGRAERSSSSCWISAMVSMPRCSLAKRM